VRFSLITGTLGRYEELQCMLESLKAQTYKDFELVLVDQNKTDDVAEMCRSYSAEVDIRYVYSDRTGLSLARNIGLQHAAGDVYAFPDDDCEYPADLLQTVADRLSKESDIDVLTGAAKDRDTGKFVVARFDGCSGVVNWGNVLRTHTSFTIFMRKDVISRVGAFDELLGCGAAFGAGEEVDLMLRTLEAGYRVHYCADLIVYHPNPVADIDSKALERAHNYGRGVGAVFGKHILQRRNLRLAPQLVSHIVRPLAGAVLYRFRNPQQSHYYRRCLAGRLSGVLGYLSASRKERD
jgi:glycosyltransferase involved in cell wall biosynthesis